MGFMIIYKTIPRKMLIKFPGQFFEKLVLFRFKEFHGLHDDLKINPEKITSDRYPIQKNRQPKKRRL